VAIRSPDWRSPGNEWIPPANAPLKLLDVASNAWTNDAEHPFIVSAIKPPNAWLLEAHRAL
jgi:hypothetical protein